MPKFYVLKFESFTGVKNIFLKIDQKLETLIESCVPF